MGGVQITHVPYKGNALALTDILGGQVSMGFPSLSTVLPHVKSGRTRAVGISSAKGSALLPDLPTVAATYAEFDVTTWMGLFAPTGTPRDIIGKVGSDVNRVIQQPDMRQRFMNQGAEVLAGSAEQLAETVQRDAARYARLIKEIGLTAD